MLGTACGDFNILPKPYEWNRAHLHRKKNICQVISVGICVCVHILLFYFPLGLNIVLINSTFQTTKKITQETETETYQPLGLSNKHIQVFGVVECILKERYFKVFLFCVRVCVWVWVCVSCYAQLFEVRISYTS